MSKQVQRWFKVTIFARLSAIHICHRKVFNCTTAPKLTTVNKAKLIKWSRTAKEVCSKSNFKVCMYGSLMRFAEFVRYMVFECF